MHLIIENPTIARLIRLFQKRPSYIIKRLKQECIFRLNKIRYIFFEKLIATNDIFLLDLGIFHFKMPLPSYLQILCDQFLQNKLSLLGDEVRNLGESIDWSKDYKSGFRWERRYCHSYDYNDLHLDNDVKYPWELTRMQFLVPLIVAYKATGERKYFQKCQFFVEDWIVKNPFAYSINYACTMDVALQMVTWFIFIQACFSEIKEDPQFYTILKKRCYLNALFISENIEESDINGNHYLSDYVGLLAAGFLFGRDDWVHRSKKELETEIMNQVYADGVDFEGSIPYHRLVLELFYFSFYLCRAQGSPLSSSYEERLKKMFRFTEAYIGPNGDAPVFGDNDNGRVFNLFEANFNDHSYLIDLARKTFGGKWRSVPDSPYSNLFELGSSFSEKDFYLGLYSFPESGMHFIHSEDVYLAVEACRIGLGGRGGHEHNDFSSFHVSLKGYDCIIDSGCYSYTFDAKRRNLFRSTAFHNVFFLKGEELNPFFGPLDLWRLRNGLGRTAASVGENSIHVRHQAFKRFDSSAFYERAFRVGNNGIHIEDMLNHKNLKGKTVQVNFHLHPSMVPINIENQRMRFSLHGMPVHIDFVCQQAFKTELTKCEVSFDYGRKTDSHKIVATLKIQELSVLFQTLIRC